MLLLLLLLLLLLMMMMMMMTCLCQKMCANFIVIFLHLKG
jgi:hypothetical protein